jgi:Protein of unknown function (DUF1553)/Protein of unknown function (DUF1549)/Planctomycete cytochrome C
VSVPAQAQTWWVAAAVASAGLLAGCGEGRAASTPAAALRYDRDVRPILAERCFMCHGQDAEKRQGRLRLDQAEGGPELRGAHDVVGADGELWRRISSSDPEERMPPADSGKPPLSDSQQATLRAWMEQGAAYEPHWSFVPPVRPPVPAVADAAWAANDVDRFLLARLEQQGLQPSPDADPALALRRLFLDLIGLPPTPVELDAFLADARPDAWERWVDKLMSEEPYRSRHAERLAVPWLDAARFADTCGIHTDAGRSLWPWRDWVLEAFRDGMPFDQFVTEQLAGDLLPDATQAQKVASGFHRNHVTTDEGGAIADEYLVEYAAERTAVTGSVFLGLTLGCARCHDHKYDPVSQKDFYSLFAFFDSIDEPGLYSQETDPTRAHEPFLEVPSIAQTNELRDISALLEGARAELARPAPEDDVRHADFLARLPAELGLRWSRLLPLEARSTGGATLLPQPDGSLLASGANPASDEHVLLLATQATDLRLLLLEALRDPSLPEGRVGRAPNGNAVLSGITLEAAPLAAPELWQPVPLVWAWADHEQADGDFGVTGALRAGDEIGWAVDAHRRDENRAALFLADAPFGFPGGTLLRATLEYRAPYDGHSLGRVRLAAAALDDAALERLPVAASSWYRVGPFPAAGPAEAYDLQIGPEGDTLLDLARNFGAGNQYWTFEPELVDGRPQSLPPGTGVVYVGRRLYAPTARSLPLSLGSDDGLLLYLDGAPVLERRVDRSLSPDQDACVLTLSPGAHVLVAKVVNTGGDAGFFYSATPCEDELSGDLGLALLPDAARDEPRAQRLREAWRLAFSPDYRDRSREVRAIEGRLDATQRAVPRTMVMREREMQRETFVLVRGQYDQPDSSRPVTRDVPAALGRLPDGAPRDRRGLAQWLLAPENPLVARVAANRLWELVFGAGLVRSTEDFGLQGEWPSHPELLDWLAVELRESGWDTRALLKLLVESHAYRQDSRVRPDVAEIDPDARLLAWLPRRRLAAEQIRDQALYLGGLLVEELGGPSVKTYQPPGLWEEVAMPASNTRVFVRGEGEDLWRRSLYTYWKRASPPPSLMTFDAPTREFCTVRRINTNTPLQALVLWNDEQFVEAARGLATRTLREAGDDPARLAAAFRRCTARTPSPTEAAELLSALADLRARYVAEPAAADGVLSLGASPVADDLSRPELAAWTLLCGALLGLDATLCRS